MIQKIWEDKPVSEDFKNANTVTIFKKEVGSLCWNIHDISQLSIADKIFAWIVRNEIISGFLEALLTISCARISGKQSWADKTTSRIFRKTSKKS